MRGQGGQTPRYPACRPPPSVARTYVDIIVINYIVVIKHETRAQAYYYYYCNISV